MACPTLKYKRKVIAEQPQTYEKRNENSRWKKLANKQL